MADAGHEHDVPGRVGPAQTERSGSGLEVRDRRRAIQRAIREGQDPPPGLEELSMQIALRQSGLRWFVVLYAFGFALEVLALAVADTPGARLRDAVLAVLFAGLGYLQWRTGQRARQAVDRWSESYPDEPSAQPPRRRRPRADGPGSAEQSDADQADPDRPDADA